MASANLRREFIRLASSTTIPATGASKVRFDIPLRSNARLVKAELRLSLTVSAAMVVGTNGSSFRLENFVKRAVFRASDTSTASRNIIDATGAELFAFNAMHAGLTSGYQQTVWGGGLLGASTTYQYILPMHFVHPAARLPMGLLQSIPFNSKVNGYGLSGTPSFEFDFASLDDEFMGLKTGTITVNRYYLVLYWYDLPPVGNPARLPDRYVPSELTAFTYDSGGAAVAELKIPVPKDGRLTSFIAFTYSTPSTGTLGEVLTNGEDGYYRIIVNNSQFDEWDPIMARHDDELWRRSYPSDVAPGSTHSFSPYIWSKNFWQPFPQAEGDNLNSVPNLYTENNGDLVQVLLDKMVANGRIKFLTHKFMTNVPDLLTGA